MEKEVLKAGSLLLSRAEILTALNNHVRLQVSREPGPGGSIGTIVAAAALDSAYRAYSGSVSVEDSERPVAVGSLALVFDAVAKAERTFRQVAAAAHMRTKLGECSVAVETVTVPSGLVSYWGFLHLGNCIVIMTLDTIDPQAVSMTDFRSLVTAAAERVESASA